MQPPRKQCHRKKTAQRVINPDLVSLEPTGKAMQRITQRCHNLHSQSRGSLSTSDHHSQVPGEKGPPEGPEGGDVPSRTARSRACCTVRGCRCAAGTRRSRSSPARGGPPAPCRCCTGTCRTDTSRRAAPASPAHTHTHTCRNTHTNTHIYPHTCTQKHTQIHTHTHTQTHTCTRKNTHTHKHAHTRNYTPMSWYVGTCKYPSMIINRLRFDYRTDPTTTSNTPKQKLHIGRQMSHRTWESLVSFVVI